MLYKKNFHERYSIIAGLIPERAEIIDVCCGDCYIYFNYLKNKNVKYLGLDINKTFITVAKKKGVRAEQFDLLNDELPLSDYIIMMGSMYHFIPHQDSVLQKILNSARKKAIISESVMNLSSSKNILIRKISKILTYAGTKHSNERFNKESLLEFFNKYNVMDIYEIKGGRDVIGIFDKETFVY
jgi:SAM-dependent methyltransferase